MDWIGVRNDGDMTQKEVDEAVSGAIDEACKDETKDPYVILREKYPNLREEAIRRSVDRFLEDVWRES